MSEKDTLAAPAAPGRGRATGDPAAGEPATSEPAAGGPAPTRPRWLVGLLASVCAVALLVAGGAVAVIGGLGRSQVPGATSVDAGFARDMQVHHLQATTMAGWVRDHGRDPVIRSLGYDIETQQLREAGMFGGWLAAWGLPASTDQEPMAWMAGSGHMGMGSSGSSGLMPGMVTSAELAKLRTLTGTPLDVYFLQLMIRHHQGGLPMAEYAAQHASEDFVRIAAQKMADAQQAEIVNMERLLRARGGTPLPAPG
jgi:uncharacterized protein (DUF305 family)